MSKNFDRGVEAGAFAGNSRLFSNQEGSLGDLVRKILQADARRRIVADNATAMTDNSGGTAPAQYKSAASALLSENDLTGLTTGVTAASLNTAADTVMNAYAVISERLNDEVFALLGAGTLDEGPGTIVTPGTVAVIDDTATANSNNTTAATYASALAVQRDLLHAQRVLIHAIDDARDAVGLARKFPTQRGRWDKTGDLTFTSEAASSPAVNGVTRSTGSWATDGFMQGDRIRIRGSSLNSNVETDVETLTATVLTFPSGSNVAVEVITAATEGNTFEVELIRRNFPGSLAGYQALGVDGPADPAGADWTLNFESGGAGISNAANGADATSAVLLAEWDAFISELADNVALMADMTDAVTDVADTAPLAYAD